MKKNIHPKYQQVLFVDSSTGNKFLCGSTLQPAETGTLDGVEYPVQRVAVSSSSHPFFTGSKGLVDAEGRVDKFKKRYAARTQIQEQGQSGQDQGQSGQEQQQEKDSKGKKSK